MLAGALLWVAPAMLSIACGDDAESPKYHPVAVSVSVIGAPTFSIGQASSGYPLAECIVALSAQAAGIGTVTWQDATFYWYTGLDRTKLQDSVVVPAPDVQASWDNATIASSAQERGGWHVSDGLPFDMAIVFRYTTSPSSATQSTRTRFTCGPAIPQGSVAPPTLSQPALAQQRVQWQPSDTLDVEFQASSTTGLWLTYADFSGAFSSGAVFGESLQSATQRVVSMQIPAAAVLGRPAVTTIFAVDAFGQEVQQSVQTSPLVGISPPTTSASSASETSFLQAARSFPWRAAPSRPRPFHAALRESISEDKKRLRP